MAVRLAAPDIIVVLTKRKIAYLEPSRDFAGTISCPHLIEENSTLDDQVADACEELFSQLGREYPSRKIIYWQQHKPVIVRTYDRRFARFWSTTFIEKDLRCALPGPLLFVRVLRDVIRARKLSVSEYFESCSRQLDKSDTLEDHHVAAFSGALLMIKHLTPFRFDCYTVSYALGSYLSSIGVSHTIHLGINPDPMVMHAWVSVNNKVILDMPSTPDEFLSVLQAHV